MDGLRIPQEHQNTMVIIVNKQLLRFHEHFRFVFISVNYNQITANILPQEPFTSEISDDVFSPQVLIAVQSAPQNKYLLMYLT